MEELSAPRQSVVYVSSLLSPEAFSACFPALSRAPGLAQQKYHRLLTEGLAEAGAKVACLSAPPLTRSNAGRLFCRLKSETRGEVTFRYLPVFTLPGAKHLVTLFSAFSAALALCKRDTLLLCDALNLMAAAGARLAARVRGANAVAIVTDVPGLQGGGRLHTRLNLALMRSFDGYVLLTEQMNALVNPQNRPYLVAEGQVDAGEAARAPQLSEKDEPPTLLYAGSLHEEYGILRLAEAFRALPGAFALHIYGAGDAEQALAEKARSDPRIRLFGVQDNAEVVRAERRATLLVNPRPSDGAFTPYSFPSKNMEYMASGTPVLTARLPGMPKAYWDYVFLLEDESAAGMTKALCGLLALPKEALLKRGAAAQGFVRAHKTGAAQGRRILAFFAPGQERKETC